MRDMPNRLTETQLNTLKYLIENPTHSIRKIAKEQGRSKTSVEQTLNQLEVKGMIFRGNKITIRVELTEFK